MVRALKKYPLPGVGGRGVAGAGAGQVGAVRESQLGMALVGYVDQVQQRRESKSRSPSRRIVRLTGAGSATDSMLGDFLDDQSVLSTDTLDIKEVQKARQYHYRPKRKDEKDTSERYLLLGDVQDTANI